MNTNQNSSVNQRLAKRAAESTALNEYRTDMSDVSFEIGSCLLIYTIVAAIMLSKKLSIMVSGKTTFYNGNCWINDEISCVKCSKF